MKRPLKQLIPTVSILLSSIVVPAYAQSLAGGAQGVAPPSNPIERTVPHPQPQVTPPEAQEEAEGPIETGPEIKVASIEITGGTIYPEADLQALLQGISGSTVHTGRIVQAVREIQAKYRNDGYF